jgi:hypothetical protein
MTIQITIGNRDLFEGEKVEEILKDIVEYYSEEDEFSKEIISIERVLDNGFSVGFYNSEIERIQRDLEDKFSEEEKEYRESLEEKPWIEQAISYWASR